MDELLSGAVGGIAQVYSGHPLDTIKVRYIKYNYASMLKCIKDMWRENPRSFYRGVYSPMAGAVISNMQTFYTYTLARKYTNSAFIAGGLTGVGLSVVETPIEIVKIQMQIDKRQKGKRMMSYRECIKKIGPRKLYKGFTITNLRNASGVACMFAVYEYVKDKLDGYPLFLQTFGAGGAAGLACWSPLMYPLDNIKTRIQSDLNKEQTIKDIVTKMKFRRLWDGFIPSMTRAIFVNSFIFAIYETTKSTIQLH